MKLLPQLIIGIVVLMSSVRVGWCGQTVESQPELKTAKAVPVKYYVALPKGWTPEENWPLLVSIDGAGHDFLGNCKEFVRARGDRGFIIVTPCVSSNGNEPADLDAVLAIVKEVQRDSKGQEKFFITGFSAGGHLTWQLVFNHPELLAGAAPAAANFRSRGITGAAKAKQRVNLPIHGFNGEKDSAALNEQWNDAIKYARQQGHKNISHDLVPGAGHERFADQVVNFFATLVPKKQEPDSEATRSAEVYAAWPFDAKEAGRRQTETAAALKVPKEVSLDLGKKVMLKLILIPAGKFVMGSPATEKNRQNNEVLHEVTITKPFYIGVYKVTQAQYEQIMGKNPSTYKGANFPVAATSWEDAAEFCKKVSEKTHRTVALPTEAQWEDMCRAGTSSAYFFGDDDAKLGDYCWGVFNWGNAMHPVGRKKPNSFGVYDVHGLMWEWARGFYGAYDPAKKVDPEDPASGSLHTARGGTYRSRPPFLRSSIRIGAAIKEGAKEEGADRFGFRVEMEVK